MKKKVVHIINGLDLGGTETALYRLLCTMPYSDYEFYVIVLGNAGHYSSRIENLGVPIHYLGIQKTNFLRAFYHLILLIRQIRPDIVQTWLYHSDLIGGLGAKLCGVKKIIWGVRCEGVELKKTTKWLKRICAILSWVIPDYIIINSKIAADNHIRAGYSQKKINIIYNGFDTNKFSPNSDITPLQKMGNKTLPLDALIIGTLARFHNDKDYSNLIKAIDAVCKPQNNVYFVLCGRGCHDDNEELNAMISDSNYQDRVILMDGIDDTACYLNKLDIFVLSSRTEGFSNSLAEAMLCGLACIATNVGDVQEILGDTGLLVPREAPKQLASACLSMINKSKDERKQQGILARDRIMQRYSMDNHKMKISAIYEH